MFGDKKLEPLVYNMLSFTPDLGNKWVKIADDDDWATRYTWERSGLSHSKATIYWNIPGETKSGKYRIKHFAASKDLLGKITHFEGTSKTFLVKE